MQIIPQKVGSAAMMRLIRKNGVMCPTGGVIFHKSSGRRIEPGRPDHGGLNNPCVNYSIEGRLRSFGATIGKDDAILSADDVIFLSHPNELCQRGRIVVAQNVLVWQCPEMAI